MPAEHRTSKPSILLTGGGRIRCARCLATSTRTGEQCGRPALKTSKTQKCQFHGGRATGPTTAEGKQRIAAAQTVRGTETRQLRAMRSQAGRRLAQLDDAMHVMGLTSAARRAGRKCGGYVPLGSREDVLRWVLERAGNLLKPHGMGGNGGIFPNTHGPNHRARMLLARRDGSLDDFEVGQE